MKIAPRSVTAHFLIGTGALLAGTFAGNIAGMIVWYWWTGDGLYPSYSSLEGPIFSGLQALLGAKIALAICEKFANNKVASVTALVASVLCWTSFAVTAALKLLLIFKYGQKFGPADIFGVLSVLATAIVWTYFAYHAMANFPHKNRASSTPLLETDSIPDIRSHAEHGDVLAQFDLAQRYSTGDGVPQDHELAVFWYGKAAAQGHLIAQTLLGLMYATGDEVPQDFKKSILWLRKAADQGCDTAQYALGLMHATGLAVPQDDKLSAMWFRKAAAQGHPHAKHLIDDIYLHGGGAYQHTLGCMFAEGGWFTQDNELAAKCFRKAAEQGHTQAQYKLGLMCRNGEGVPQNHAESFFWLTLAASSGNVTMIDARNEVAKMLTPDIISAINNRASKWEPTPSFPFPPHISGN